MFRKIFARVRSNNPDHDDQTPEVAHRLQNNQGTLPQKEELTSIATFSGDNKVKEEGAIEQATSKLAEKSVERPPQDASHGGGNAKEAKKSTMEGPSKRRRMVHEEIKRLEGEIKWRKEEIRATAEEAKPRRERIEELLQHMGVTERRKERMEEKREEFEEDRSEIAEERKWIAKIRDKIARQREQIGRYRGVIARSKDSSSQSEILELPMPEGLLVRRMNEREKELGLVEWKINLYEGYLNRKEVRLKRLELKVNLEEEEMNQRDKALEPELKELNQRMDDVNQLKEDIRSMKEQVRALKEINRQNSAQIIGYSPDGGLFRYAPAPEYFNSRKLNPVASAEWETRWEPSSFPYLCIEKFNASCVICQGDFAEPLQTLGECSASTEVAEEAPELLRQLPCRHVFHRVCIDDMLQNSSRSCPVCRRRVDKEFIQHVYASEDMSDEDGSWENVP